MPKNHYGGSQGEVTEGFNISSRLACKGDVKMDKQDAIKCLKSMQQWIPDWDDREDGLSYWDAFDRAIAALPPPNEPLTLGLVDKYGAPLYAGDTLAADKFFMYAIRYGSHNVNPEQCEPAYQVGWYLEIVWAYPGFEDSVGHTEPLYDIDGVAARYPAHCADTTDGIDNLKFEKVTRRPPEGEA